MGDSENEITRSSLIRSCIGRVVDLGTRGSWVAVPKLSPGELDRLLSVLFRLSGIAVLLHDSDSNWHLPPPFLYDGSWDGIPTNLRNLFLPVIGQSLPFEVLELRQRHGVRFKEQNRTKAIGVKDTAVWSGAGFLWCRSPHPFDESDI